MAIISGNYNTLIGYGAQAPSISGNHQFVLGSSSGTVYFGRAGLTVSSGGLALSASAPLTICGQAGLAGQQLISNGSLAWGPLPQRLNSTYMNLSAPFASLYTISGQTTPWTVNLPDPSTVAGAKVWLKVMNNANVPGSVGVSGSASVVTLLASVPQLTVTMINGDEGVFQSDGSYWYILSANRVLSPPVPVLLSATPNNGPYSGGNNVVFTGTGFTSATQVTLGGISTTYTVNNDTTITVSAPKTSTIATVSGAVTSLGGTSVSNNFYSYCPVVTSFTPTQGPVGGNQPITVTGSGITINSNLTIGNNAANIISITAPNTIQATTPVSTLSGGIGPAQLIVTTNGCSSSGLVYSYIAPSTIYGITPTAGPLVGGNLVTICGVNFNSGGASLTISGNSATNLTVLSDSLLTASAPAGLVGLAPVVVTTLGGPSNSLSYTYSPVPIVSSILPNSGALSGGPVTISGANFTGVTAVTLCGAVRLPTTYTLTNDNQILATLPQILSVSAGSYYVLVTTPGGNNTPSTSYVYYAPPVLTTLSPASGPITGLTSLTATGSGFVNGLTSLTLGSTVASLTLSGTNYLTASAPAGSFVGSVSAYISTPGGQSNYVQYGYNPLLVGVSPQEGPTTGNQSVTLTGSGFTSNSIVTFGGLPANSVTLCGTSLIGLTPSGTVGSATVQVNISGYLSNPGSYIYDAIPTITGLNPASGPILGNSLLSITGTGFVTTSSVVTIGGYNATICGITTTNVTVLTPTGDTVGPYPTVISTPGGSSAPSQYVYNPIITSITPSIGPLIGNQALILTGSGFAASSTVLIGNTLATSVTLSGPTLVAYTPSGALGTVPVTVTTNGYTSASGQYSYVAVPAVTSIVLPYGPLQNPFVTINGTGFLNVNLNTGVSVSGVGTAFITPGSVTDNTFTASLPTDSTDTINGLTTPILVTTPGGTSLVTPSSYFSYVPYPSIIGTTPSYGPVAGNQSITICGTGFTPSGNVQVTFGTNPQSPGTNVVTVSSSLMTAATPAYSVNTKTSVPITIFNPIGSSLNQVNYTYYPLPVITSVLPNLGPLVGGQNVTICGTGFLDATLLSFSGAISNSAPILTITDTVITCTTPSGMYGPAYILLTTPGGANVPTTALYQYASGPVISSISPQYGAIGGGQLLTICGSSFTGASSVTLCGTTINGLATISSITDSVVTVTTPAEPVGPAYVLLTTPAGTSPATTVFTYAPSPTILANGVIPNEGKLVGGDTITICGTTFINVTAVTISGISATNITVCGPTVITATTPAGVLGAAPLVVSTVAGSAASTFTYDPVPTLTYITPSGGPLAGGTLVTVSGTGFINNNSLLTIGGGAATICGVTSSAITALTPAGTGSTYVNVTTPGGTASGLIYQYYSSPSALLVTPSAGPLTGGQVVNLSGNNLAGPGIATTVTVSSAGILKNALVTSASTNLVTIVTPSGLAGSAEITVLAPGGSVSGQYQYEIIPIVQSANPTAGPLTGGNLVTLYGAGFTDALAVSICGATASVAATISSITETSLVVTMPAGTVSIPGHGAIRGTTATIGSGTIKVTTLGGTNVSGAIYTYATVPTVSLVTPVSGPISGGTVISVTGTGYQIPGITPTVYLSGLGASGLATGVTVCGNTLLTAITPLGYSLGAGPTGLYVNTPGGTSGVNSLYAYNPVVYSVVPSNGSINGGQAVTLSGYGFSASSLVSFGNTAATNVNYDNGVLMALTPTVSTSGPVSVLVSTSGYLSASGPTYSYYAPPTVTSVVPASGPITGSGFVTITGTGFSNTTSLVTLSGVSFGSSTYGVATGVTVCGDTTITAYTPSGAVIGPTGVFVTTSGGTNIANTLYAYNPAVQSVTPNNGPMSGNLQVTLSGYGFGSSSVVTFGGTQATDVVYTNGKLTVNSPPMPNSGPVTIRVSTSGYLSASGPTFTYVVSPYVSLVTPVSGPITGGSSITISGAGFLNTTPLVTLSNAYTYGVATNVIVLNDNTITATTPSGAIVGPVGLYVSTTAGVNGANTLYNYNPVVSAVAPSTGPIAGGQTVTLSGYGFGSNSLVSFGNNVATSAYNAGILTAVTPQVSSSGSVTVLVSTSGYLSASGPTYTYFPVPSVTLVTPTNGAITNATSLTINGTGYANTTPIVSLSGPGNFGLATNVTVCGDTTITASAPLGSTAGAVGVFVTTSGGTNSPNTLYGYNPVITGIVPANGSINGYQQVTLSGYGFGSNSTIAFGNTSALNVTYYANSGTLVALTPPVSSSGAVTVYVTTSNYTSLSGPTYTYYVAPTVSLVTPVSGPITGGTNIIITGTGYANTNPLVTLSGSGMSPTVSGTVVNDTTITAQTPAGSVGNVSVYVTTSGGTSAFNQLFHYNPVVTSITPIYGSTTGGQPVTLSGYGFNNTSIIVFGNTVATNVVYTNGLLTALTPASSSGPVTVLVTTAGYQSTSGPTFTYYQVPTVTSVTPASGPITNNTPITITGTGYTGTYPSVLLSGPGNFGLATNVQVIGDGTINAITPSGSAAGPVSVFVTTSGGTSLLNTFYGYNPVIAGITPTYGSTAGGQTVNITGYGFSNSSLVQFGNAQASSSYNAGTLTATTPVSISGPVTVLVTTSGYQSASGPTYLYYPVPTVSLVTPASGPITNINGITITGTGYANTTPVVTLSGPGNFSTATILTVCGDNTITAQVQAGTAAGAVGIFVTTSGGTNTLNTLYGYNPVVTTVTPTAGPAGGGQTVSLSGYGFSASSLVSFGGLAAQNVAYAGGLLTATTPASTGTATILITTSGYQSASGPQYTFTGPPTVTSVAPIAGPLEGGQLVTICGTGFTGTTKVTLSGDLSAGNLTGLTISSNVITGTTPTGSGNVSIYVTSTGGTNTTGPVYSYNPPPLITAINPSYGASLGGTSVTICGSNFVVTGPTYLTLSGSFGIIPLASTISNTFITASMPAYGGGAAALYVQTYGGTASGMYQYYDRPTITSINPSVGPVVGNQAITVCGTNYISGLTTITLGGASLSGPVTVTNSTISGYTTAAPGLLPTDSVVQITTPGGTVSGLYHYVVAPTITSLTPNSGPISGSPVTICGTSFTYETSVLFNALNAAVTVCNDTTLIAAAPAGSALGPINVTVTNVAGTSANSQYTYNPVITALTPGNGSPSTSQNVTISGSGLASTTAVYFNGSSVDFAYNAGVLTASAPTNPAGPGQATVYVAASNYTSNQLTYLYNPVPIVTGVSPVAGPLAGGTLITITGTGFTTNSTVTVSGIAATGVAIPSTTQITAYTPGGVLGTGNVIVTSSGGGSFATASGTFTYDPAPTLTSVSPNYGSTIGGNSIMINGGNFVVTGAAATVTVSGSGGPVPAYITASNNAFLTVSMPIYSPGEAALYVSTPGGTVSGSYLYYAPPTISSIQPSSGQTVGNQVLTICGANFVPNATGVTISGVPVSGPITATTNTITTRTPSGIVGVAPLLITTSGGTVSGVFTYNAPPLITGLSTNSGPVSATALTTVLGTNFTGATQVSFSGQLATINSQTDTSINVSVPSYNVPSTVAVVVYTPSGGYSNTGSYSYYPTLSAIQNTNYPAAIPPAAGPLAGNTLVNITGNGLTNVTSVTISGAPASFTKVSDMLLTAVTPAGIVGAAPVVVACSQYISPPIQYWYEQIPVVSYSTPNSGPITGGSQLTICGTYFSTISSNQYSYVTLCGPVSVSATILTVSDSVIVVTTPAASAVGPEYVIVQTPGGTSQATSNAVYSNYPVVTGVNRNYGPLVGNQQVSISGNGFGSNSTVTFGNNNAVSVQYDSPTLLTAVTPAGAAGVVNVTVNTSGYLSVSSAASQFTYVVPPTVTEVVANSGPVTGSQITITGTNFTGVATNGVTIGGVAATVQSSSSTSITANTGVTSVAGPTNVVVTSYAGTSQPSAGSAYSYNPQIYSITPLYGPVTGNNLITISGLGFNNNSTVTFGSNLATNVYITASGLLTVSAPANLAGSTPVIVTTSGCTSNAASYTYYSFATVSAFTPTAGPIAGNQLVTICGSNFATTTGVKIAGVAANNFSVNGDVITAYTGATGAATSGPVQITNYAGASSSVQIYSYNLVPTITGVWPAAGPLAGGNLVSICGTNFINNASIVNVTDNTTSLATISSLTSNLITATMPSKSIGTSLLSVTTPGGTSNALNYTYNGIPTITEISPGAGPAAGGTLLSIYGTNFVPGSTQVSISNNLVTASVPTETLITFTTPLAIAGYSTVSITTPGGSVSGQYLYVNAPTIASLTPNSGPITGLNQVTICGTDFLSPTVLFGSTKATITLCNSNTLIATAPAYNQTAPVDVTVSATGGISTKTQYSYNPVIYQLLPNSGPLLGNTSITISGAGFATASITAVTFGGLSASGQVMVNGGNIIATTPAGLAAGSVPVVVTMSGGLVSNSGSYLYVSAPIVSYVVPNSGFIIGGTSITVCGQFLTNATSVAIGGALATKVNVLSDTVLTASTGVGSTAGATNVIVSTVGGNSAVSASSVFGYNPYIYQLLPNSGPLLGNTSITISGAGLATASVAAVTFGSLSASGKITVSGDYIIATTPAGLAAGSVPVIVTLSGGFVSNSGNYQYVTAPAVSSVIPNSGPIIGGTSITVCGQYLTNTASVRVGGVLATNVSVLSDNVLTASTGLGSTIGINNVVITSVGGSSLTSASSIFDYNPYIYQLLPNSGALLGNTIVTISGAGFATVSVSKVTFGGLSASGTVSVSGGYIIATTPAGLTADSVPVVVTMSGGFMSNSGSYLYVNAPIVASVIPNSGPITGGTGITICGQYFTNTTSLTIGGITTTLNVLSDSVLTASTGVGSAVGVANVQVIATGGTSVATASSIFNYNPVILSVTPTIGPLNGNTAITISGVGLENVKAVTFGGIAASGAITVAGGLITTRTPFSTVSGPVPVVVTVSGGFLSNSGVYTYVTAPSVSSILPNSGPVSGSTSVTINGAFFTGTPSNGVTIAGIQASNVVVQSDSRLTASTNYSNFAGSGYVTITATGGTATSSVLYGYNPVVDGAQSFGPTSGGTPVTLTGLGFTPSSTVTFGGISSSGPITFTNSGSISATSPPGNGDVSVIVTSSGCSSLGSYIFHYVPPITVSSITPSVGPTTGLQDVTLTGTNFLDGFLRYISLAGVNASLKTIIDNNQATFTTGSSVDSLYSFSGPVVVNSVFNPPVISNVVYQYDAVPTIVGINPSAGPLVGNQLVTLCGTNFDSQQTTVAIGGIPSSGPVLYSSSGVVSFYTPAMSDKGTYGLLLTTSGGGAFNVYTYEAVPTITNISPAQGPLAGKPSITLRSNGGGMAGATLVTVCGVLTSKTATITQINDDSSIVVTMPSGDAGPATVTVTSPGGVGLPNPPGSTFTYLNPPTLTSVLPNSGAISVSSNVTIIGTGLASTNLLTISNATFSQNIPFTPSSDTTILTTLPAILSTADSVGLYVTTDGGSNFLFNSGNTYYYNPTVSSISPSVGALAGGLTITIRGLGFNTIPTQNVVKIGSLTASMLTSTTNVITAVTPNSTSIGTYPVNIITNNCTSTGGLTFQYLPVPYIAAITPPSGPITGNTSVIVTGSGFTGITSLTLAGTQPVYTVSGDTIVNIVAPSTITPGSTLLNITTSGGTVSGQYIYNTTVPTISGVYPNIGTVSGGTSITISGTGYITGATATLSGRAVTNISVQNNNKITANTPSGIIGLAPITVSTAGGLSASSLFWYVTTPTITSIVNRSDVSFATNAGPMTGGSSLTVNGTNFIPSTTTLGNSATTMTLSGTAVTLQISNPGSIGITETSATAINVPPISGGASQITISAIITTPGGSASYPYVYCPVPVLTGITPLYGPLSAQQVTVSGTGFITADNPQTNWVTVSLSGGYQTVKNVTISGNGTLANLTIPQSSVAAAAPLYVQTPGGTSNLITFNYLAPPTVTSVSPLSGPITGGSLITICGTSFINGLTSVSICGPTYSGAATPLLVTPTSITATTPSGLIVGPASVLVTAPGGTSLATASSVFTYYPVISGVSPNNGPYGGNTPLTITGKGLINTKSVTIGNLPVSGNITICGDTTILVNAPKTTVSSSFTNTYVIVTASGGYISVSSPASLYTYDPLPITTGITPAVGSVNGNTLITICGAYYLSGGTAATISGLSVSGITLSNYTVLSGYTTLQGYTPSGIVGTAPVVVTTTGGSVSGLTYQYYPVPSVNTLTPYFGVFSGGNLVTICGSNFISGAYPTTVTICGTTVSSALTANTITNNAITVSMVAGRNTANIYVTNIGGTSLVSASSLYTFVTDPTITSVTPNEGPIVGNQTVTISGNYFIPGSTSVKFNNTAASGSVIVNTAGTQLTVVTPYSVSGAGLFGLTVSTNGGSVLGSYRYDPVPTFTGVSPLIGPTAGRQSITISGTGFTTTGTTTVTISGRTSTITTISGTLITATTPSGVVGVAPLVVTTPGGTCSGLYQYQSPPVITYITPSSGYTYGNQFVTICGTNLQSSSSVNIGGAPITSLTINGAGTAITGYTPAGANGATTAQVTTLGVVSNTLPFTYYVAPYVNFTEVDYTAGVTTIQWATPTGSTIGNLLNYRINWTYLTGGTIFSGTTSSGTTIYAASPTQNAQTNFEITPVYQNANGPKSVIGTAYPTYQSFVIRPGVYPQIFNSIWSMGQINIYNSFSDVQLGLNQDIAVGISLPISLVHGINVGYIKAPSTGEVTWYPTTNNATTGPVPQSMVAINWSSIVTSANRSSGAIYGVIRAFDYSGSVTFYLDAMGIITSTDITGGDKPQGLITRYTTAGPYNILGAPNPMVKTSRYAIGGVMSQGYQFTITGFGFIPNSSGNSPVVMTVLFNNINAIVVVDSITQMTVYLPSNTNLYQPILPITIGSPWPVLQNPPSGTISAPYPTFSLLSWVAGQQTYLAAGTWNVLVTSPITIYVKNDQYVTSTTIAAMASNFVTGTGVTVAASNASNGTVAWNIPANTIIGLNWAPWLISGSTAIYLTNGTYLSSTLTAPNLTVNSTGTINTVVGTLPQITGTYSPPIINTVTPSSGYTTQLVTIAGYNLPTTGVTGTIGGSLLTNISYTSSGITGLIPNLSAGSYSLYITTPAGQSNSLPFQVLVSPIVTRTYTLNNVGGAWSRANGAFVGYYQLTPAVGVQGNVTQISVNFSTNVDGNFTNGCFAFLFNKVPPAGQSNAGNFGGWQPLFGSPYSLLNFQATIDITPYAVNTSDPIYLQLWAYWSYDSIILTTATVTLTILQT